MTSSPPVVLVDIGTNIIPAKDAAPMILKLVRRIEAHLAVYMQCLMIQGALDNIDAWGNPMAFGYKGGPTPFVEQGEMLSKWGAKKTFKQGNIMVSAFPKDPKAYIIDQGRKVKNTYLEWGKVHRRVKGDYWRWLRRKNMLSKPVPARHWIGALDDVRVGQIYQDWVGPLYDRLLDMIASKCIQEEWDRAYKETEAWLSKLRKAAAALKRESKARIKSRIVKEG